MMRPKDQNGQYLLKAISSPEHLAVALLPATHVPIASNVAQHRETMMHAQQTLQLRCNQDTKLTKSTQEKTPLISI